MKTKTKVVCTLGPSVSSDAKIEALITEGMSVARLNMAHGTLVDHRQALERLRTIADRVGVPVGTMVDVPGAKYRTGPLGAGALTLERGETITLTSQDVVGTQDRVGVSPVGIHRAAAVGEAILVDDGLIELQVGEIRDQDVACEVVRGGRLTERPGRRHTGPLPGPTLPR